MRCKHDLVLSGEALGPAFSTATLAPPAWCTESWQAKSTRFARYAFYLRERERERDRRRPWVAGCRGRWAADKMSPTLVFFDHFWRRPRIFLGIRSVLKMPLPASSQINTTVYHFHDCAFSVSLPGTESTNPRGPRAADLPSEAAASPERPSGFQCELNNCSTLSTRAASAFARRRRYSKNKKTPAAPLRTSEAPVGGRIPLLEGHGNPNQKSCSSLKDF
jgi:hypothetical protein